MSALGGEHMHEIRKLSEPLAAPLISGNGARGRMTLAQRRRWVEE